MEARGQSVQAISGARRREATQNDIVFATRRLLMEGEPVTRLSVDRIVHEAGVSRATFYLHFSDKRDVIARLAEEIVAQREIIGEEALASFSAGRDAMNAVFATVIERWMRDAPLLSAIIELAEYDPVMRERWQTAIRKAAATGSEVMRRHRGASTDVDSEAVAEALTWMIERCAHQMARDPSQHDRVAAALAEIVWRVFDYEPR